MKNLTATICLTIAVPLGSVWGGRSWAASIPANAIPFREGWVCSVGQKRRAGRCIEMSHQ